MRTWIIERCLVTLNAGLVCSFTATRMLTIATYILVSDDRVTFKLTINTSSLTQIAGWTVY